MHNPVDVMAAAFEDELQKIASAKAEKRAMSAKAMKALGLMGAGAAAFEMTRRAERDRKLGRSMRLQNAAYGM